ncbi:LytTR family DNA-binding domain-containing protein [Chryseobacterium sp. PS-8]|uniref:LytTR family DNA-binding domain-containing protein n=1 Tax=Chryseobacterium indicum TaxID=2766954 RepID=A0ABS9C9L4_9FLAO|nr:LytTR family DNA-binding domain-containing protein [Chryseobacterium sp. PS-8]MCF2221003.1 LytTR family DNA-binding domain-containing protein [Chryseobacterium sp. PS-8]
MKSIIIDDEILNIKNLEWYISENFPDLELLNSFTNIQSASDFITKNCIDLIFLDIQMPLGSGFDFLEMFPERSFQVIFVTAFEEYALKAIKAGATDYILKPLLKSELLAAVEKAKKIYQQNNQFKKSAKICLQNAEGKFFVEPEEILYIQGIDNISKVFLTRNRKIILSKSLKHFEETLENDFFRIHKSYLVNVRECKHIDTSRLLLSLSNDIKLPISRRNFKNFKEKLNAC